MQDLALAAAPPLRNKHQKRTDATRQALLNAARRIFARDGFEACRIEDIAAATGHTRGAFYAHFQSKEDLFFALLEMDSKRRAEQLRGTLASCATPERRMAALRQFFASRLADRRWALLTLEFKLYALRHPDLRPALAATHRRIRAAFRLEGVTGAHDEELKAALEGILAGVSLEHSYDPLRLPKRAATRLLGEIFDALVTGV